MAGPSVENGKQHVRKTSTYPDTRGEEVTRTTQRDLEKNHRKRTKRGKRAGVQFMD